jgi:hypothetical protein
LAERPLETFLTLVLEHADAELSQAHRELYPERIPEQIPLSLTLLYPWVPAEEVGEVDLAKVREFFAGRPVLEFDLTSLAEFPGAVVYEGGHADGGVRARPLPRARHISVRTLSSRRNPSSGGSP